MTTYLKADFSKCAESLLESNYSKLDDVSKAELDRWLSCCKFKNVTKDSDLVWKGTFVYPSIEKTVKRAVGDSGFVSDYENAVLSLATPEAKKALVQEYLTTAIGVEAEDMSEATVTVEMKEAGDSYVMKADLALYQIIKNAIEYDLVGSVEALMNGESSEGKDGESAPAEHKFQGFTKVDSDKVFMYQQNDARLLVKDINVEQGEAAMKIVRGLSSVNKNLSTKEQVYFISYKVKNLSMNEVQVTDNFKMISSSGEVLGLDGSHVSGIQSVANVKPGEEVELTSFLIGPTDASVAWYKEDVIGCYSLNIVQ